MGVDEVGGAAEGMPEMDEGDDDLPRMMLGAVGGAEGAGDAVQDGSEEGANDETPTESASSGVNAASRLIVPLLVFELLSP